MYLNLRYSYNYTFHRVQLSYTLLLPTITRLSAIEASFYETYEKLLSAVFDLLTSVIIVETPGDEPRALSFSDSRATTTYAISPILRRCIHTIYLSFLVVFLIDSKTTLTAISFPSKNSLTFGNTDPQYLSLLIAK